MKTLNRKITNVMALAVVMAVIISTGCEPWDRIEGNGDVITEKRSVVPFNRVESNGSFNVLIVQDSVFDVNVLAESNLMPYIRTRVHNNTLEIDSRGILFNTEPVWIYVYLPELYEMELNGSGMMDASNFICTDLDIELNGSGDIYCSADVQNLSSELHGSGNIELDLAADYLEARIEGSGDYYMEGLVPEADMEVHGSGDIHAYNLVINRCFINIAGSGDAELYVTDLLDVNISGSGSVYYLGTPTVNTKITGSGKVVHANK